MTTVSGKHQCDATVSTHKNGGNTFSAMKSWNLRSYTYTPAEEKKGEKKRQYEWRKKWQRNISAKKEDCSSGKKTETAYWQRKVGHVHFSTERRVQLLFALIFFSRFEQLFYLCHAHIHRAPHFHCIHTIQMAMGDNDIAQYFAWNVSFKRRTFCVQSPYNKFLYVNDILMVFKWSLMCTQFLDACRQQKPSQYLLYL